MYPNHDQLMLDLYASSINPSYGLHIDDSFDDALHGAHREVWERMHLDNSREGDSKNGGTTG